MMKFKTKIAVILIAIAAILVCMTSTVLAEETEVAITSEETDENIVTSTLGDNDGVSLTYDLTTKTLIVTGEIVELKG